MSVHGEKSEGDKLEDPLKSVEQCLQPDATSITVGPEQRKSSRERKSTPKMLELKEKEIGKGAQIHQAI